MKLIYLSYPVTTSEDLNDAEFLLSELQRKFNAIFWAPWIPCCRYWLKDEESRLATIIYNALSISAEFWAVAPEFHELKLALQLKCFTERFDCRTDLLWMIENITSSRAMVIKNRLEMK